MYKLLYEELLIWASVELNACVCICNLTYVLLIRLALLCISSASGSSLHGSAGREGLDIRVCFGFRDCGGLVGGPESRSSMWAAGLHPVPGILLCGEFLPWLGSQSLICFSEEPFTGGIFTLQVPNEVRSSLQLSAKVCIF